MTAPAKPTYQPDRASARIGAAGLLSMLALAILAGAVVFGLFAAFRALRNPAPATSLERIVLAPQGPRLESDPRRDRLALEARAHARLEGYAWVDRKAGIARIPIERAMALQAARGWPDTRPAKP